MITLLKVVVFLGVPGVLAFDALSCFVNGGLAGGVAEGAARSAGQSAGGRPMSNQQAYLQAAEYIAKEDPDYTVVPESVLVDNRTRTVSLAVEREAPTLVLKHLSFAREWTEIRGDGTFTDRS